MRRGLIGVVSGIVLLAAPVGTEDRIEIRGVLADVGQSTDRECYVAVGEGLMIAAPPGEPCGWLKQHLGQDVVVTVEGR